MNEDKVTLSLDSGGTPTEPWCVVASLCMTATMDNGATKELRLERLPVLVSLGHDGQLDLHVSWRFAPRAWSNSIEVVSAKPLCLFRVATMGENLFLEHIDGAMFADGSVVVEGSITDLAGLEAEIIGGVSVRILAVNTV